VREAEQLASGHLHSAWWEPRPRAHPERCLVPTGWTAWHNGCRAGPRRPCGYACSCSRRAPFESAVQPESAAQPEANPHLGPGRLCLSSVPEKSEQRFPGPVQEDVRNIEAGCVPLPKYLGTPEPLCVTTTAVRTVALALCLNANLHLGSQKAQCHR